MKYILSLCLAASLFSCHETATPVANELPKVDSVVPAADSTDEDYDLSIRSEDVVPPGILTEDKKYIDSVLNLQVNIVYAYPDGDARSAYMQLVHELIDTSFQKFEAAVKSGNKEEDSDDGLPNDFTATPINYYQDSTIVSIRYWLSDYTSGAVHADDGLISINYDKVRQKKIGFNDYFNIKTPADSAFMAGVFDENLGFFKENFQNPDDAWGNYNISHLDFNIKKDTISFNFPMYALGNSMVEYRVAKSRLNKVIQPAYQ